MVKLKEVGYGGVFKAMDSEVVTKKFKKNQKDTKFHDAFHTTPVCLEICEAEIGRYAIFLNINRYLLWKLSACRLGSALELEKQSGRVASAHKACKSLVRVRCSLKHLLNSYEQLSR